MSRSMKLVTLASVVVAIVILAISHLLSTRSRAPTATRSERPTVTKPIAGRTEKRKAQEPPQRATLVSVDWDRSFRESHDYFNFVLTAAAKALAGDGRAALYVSRALTTCKLETTLYGNATNPEVAFEADLATKPSAPRWVLDRARNEFKACNGFFNGHVFASLPQQSGDYESIAYWRDLAYRDGDPIAEAIHAGLGMARIAPGAGDSYAEARSAAQLDLNSAVISQDPGAIFTVGRVLLDAHTNGPLDGVAVTIAACDMGYDCSANNEAIFGQCAASDTCTAGVTWADIITQGIGAAAYAKAYARAQQFEDAATRGDNSALLEFVQLGGTR